MKHTAEPWIAGDACLIMTNIFSGGLRVARCDFDGDHENPEAQANARRIVACVNALEGIPTLELEKAGTGMMSDSAVCVGKLTKQRDSLLSVLKEVIKGYPVADCHCENCTGKLKRARDLIASIEAPHETPPTH